jgi:alanyl-tRNA synthetase
MKEWNRIVETKDKRKNTWPPAEIAAETAPYRHASAFCDHARSQRFHLLEGIRPVNGAEGFIMLMAARMEEIDISGVCNGSKYSGQERRIRSSFLF